MDRRKLEEKMKQEGRLPPGQSLTVKFPVLHYGPVPPFDPDSWDLRLDGQVEQEVQWTWEQVQALPRRRVKMDLHCVTRWSKFDTEWEGISLRDLIEEGLIALKPAAAFVLQHCEYGYTTNLPLNIALSDNFLLALKFNGADLTPEHGSPLRGVVGQIVGRDDLKTPYLWKGGKWLRRLEFLSEDQKGFWEQAGYHNEGDVWKEQRFS